MARVAVFGDISGWGNPFYYGLMELGVDLQTGAIPPDLKIIQVGDLIHKGPDSDEIVAIVDLLMNENPGQWIQLMGNHEAEHLGGQGFWQCDCSNETLRTLRRWVRSGAMVLASAVNTRQYGEMLLTHAGLTYGTWREIAGPRSAFGAAELLNELRNFDQEHAFSAGKILTNSSSPYAPGVVWAIAGEEVYTSWEGKSVPFGQIHGHTNPYDFFNKEIRAGVPKELEVTSQFTTLVKIGGKAFIGTDPGFTAKWHRPVNHAVVLAT